MRTVFARRGEVQERLSFYELVMVMVGWRKSRNMIERNEWT